MFDSCYPQCLESLGEESPRLFFLAGRGEKCLELLGVGKSSRSNLEAFGQGETGKVSYSISVAFVALTSLLRAICRERGISDCSGAVLADLGKKVMKGLFAGVIACYSKEADKYEFTGRLM